MANEKNKPAKAKQVIDGLAANAFRVVGVGQDIVLESFYLYPDLSQVKEGQPIEFSMDPENSDEPNIRVIMNRQVATRLAAALLDTLGIQRIEAPAAAQPAEQTT